MIIFAVKFFFEQTIITLSRNFTCYIFFLFAKKMIKVVWAIFIVIIKDLEMRLGNSSLVLEKNIM